MIAAAGLALIVLLVVFAVAMRRGLGGEADGRVAVSGLARPAFTLQQFDGQQFVAADHADGPLFVYFWASWCVPCQQEAPIIEQLWPEYRARGYTFIGINIWDAQSDARRFIQEQHLSFPVAPDAASGVYLDYGVSALPAAFFLDPGLHVRTRYNGPLDEPTLRGLLDEMAKGAEAS